MVGNCRRKFVVAVDAGSYGASVLGPGPADGAGRDRVRMPVLRELAEGWAQFQAQTWLWVTTVQFALFNVFIWAPSANFHNPGLILSSRFAMV